MDTHNKQAYLIIAHKDDMTFRTLLRMLDNDKNDIFIHMDKKNKTYDPSETENLVTHSCLYHSERSSVTWGGYSQINAELILLKFATEKGHYQHYHLLSGQDLPIQTQGDIQSFFEENDGKEFVGYDKPEFHFGDRVYYRWFLQEQIGRRSLLKVIQKPLVYFQRKLRIKRNTEVRFQKGANWFSITDELAGYVVSKEDWIREVFKDSFCADEVFLQTVVENSDAEGQPFKDNLYWKVFDNSHSQNMRCIDWKRGLPYTWHVEDMEELIESPLMFARKFDCAVDAEIIKKIYEVYGKHTTK